MAFAAISVYAGIAGLIDFGPGAASLRAQVGSLTQLFNLVYLLAGCALFFGVGMNKRNLEASGLVLLLTSLLIRMIALIGWAHADKVAIINSLVSFIIFTVAIIARLWFVLSGCTMVVAKSVKIPTVSTPKVE